MDRVHKINYSWQESYSKYVNACAIKGLFKFVPDLKSQWINVDQNGIEVTFNPKGEMILPSSLNMKVNYQN